MAAADVLIQVGILVFTLAIFISIQYFPKHGLTKIRTKDRTTLQTNRHFLQATKFLNRAKSTAQKSQTLTLAKNALVEAETAISISPREPSLHILKGLALDLLGHKGSALRSIDLALNFPRVKSLSGKERGDALVKRAELKLEVNRKRRVDSAIEDLKEAVRLLGGRSERLFCLLGECYEWKGMREESKWAFQEALRVQPDSVPAREGLSRLGL